MYLIRLDDASEYMDVKKWYRIETLLDYYNIKPIVGIIPNNQDEKITNLYDYNPEFWTTARAWQEKEWSLALHGNTHVYLTYEGGLNPVNSRSEFAGVPLDKQIDKITQGLKVFDENRIETKMFFAPSHTFDMNTLIALRQASNIRIISDTIANDIYKMRDFYFIPQQSGKVRRLPFKLTTFCYHPNNMSSHDFDELERFIEKYQNKFISFNNLSFTNKKATLYDKFLKEAYFCVRVIRRMLFSKK